MRRGSVIGSGVLATTDADNTAAELSYTLTSVPANGTMFLSGLALGLGDSFTQADVYGGLVTYDHDGSETTSDGFGFDVTYGTDTIAGESFAIAITPVDDDLPTLGVNTGSTVLEGGTECCLQVGRIDDVGPHLLRRDD